MTTFDDELIGLVAHAEAIMQAFADTPLGDEDAARAYEAFCIIGEMLGPLIGQHMHRLCEYEVIAEKIREEAEKHPDRELPEELSDEGREYNTQMLIRLLYDLAPAIGPAFIGAGKTVWAIADDLDSDLPPLTLRKKRNVRGKSGHKHARVKKTAKYRLYDIVVYEAARTQCDEAATFQRLMSEHGIRTGGDYWRNLRRYQRSRPNLKAHIESLRNQAVGTGQPHENISWLQNSNFRALISPG